MKSLVVRNPMGEEWQSIKQQAQMAVKSNLLPNTINTPEKAVVVALKGRELGIPMMQAFSQINIISGNANSEVLHWLGTTGKKAITKKLTDVGGLEHILDFLNSDSAPSRLRKMSFKDAKRKSQEWSERNQKKGRDLIDANDDLELIHDFLDGNKIVRLTSKKAYQREGFLMNHCVGGYDPSESDCLIYSYRDSQNMPHATFEVRKNSEEIVQIKGKGNGPIHPKYIHPILAFLKSIGMEIRPYDMQSEAVFSSRSHGLYAKFDHASRSWKMSQLSLLEEASKSLQRLTTWGNKIKSFGRIQFGLY